MENLIKLRRSVFETNSSSSHSISIDSDGVIDVGNLASHIDDGVLVIVPDGEFGWGPEEYTDPYTKAQYLVMQALYEEDSRGSIYIDSIKSVLEEVTGVDKVIISGRILDNEDEYDYGHGYIDHQSIGEFTDILNDPYLIKEFIFKRTSELIISNDNM